MKKAGAVLALALWAIRPAGAQPVPETPPAPEAAIADSTAFTASADTLAAVAPPAELRRSHMPLDLLAGRIAAALAADLRPAGGEGLGQRLQRALDLAPAQRRQLDLLRRDMQQELDWIYAQVADLSMAAATARKRFRAAAALQRQRLAEILTPQQYELLQRGRDHLLRRPRRQPHPSAQLQIARHLELDRRQTAQWYEILRQQRRLLWEMRQAGGEPSRQALRQLRQEHRMALEELLAPPQRQRLAEMRRQWQERRQAAAAVDTE